MVDAARAKPVYNKGVDNAAADALSRSRVVQEDIPNQWDVDSIVFALLDKTASGEVDDGAQRDAIRALQKADPEIMAVIESIEQATIKTPSDCEIKKNYSLLDGVLYAVRKDGLKVVVPISETQRLLKEHHTLPCGGHLASGKVLGTLQQRYYWPRMEQHVLHYCRSCVICAERQGQGNRPKPPLTSVPLPTRPMELIAMDLLQIQGSKELVMVLVDYLTRYTWAYPITNKKAETVARVLVEQFYPAAGIPERVISDRGLEFTNKLVSVLDDFYGIERSLTTAYHPKSDGRVERMNRTLLDMLSKVSNAQGGRWQSHLGSCLLAYNCSVHSSTGLSPHYCLFGRVGIIPSSSELSKRISPHTWTMQSWPDQLPHHLRYVWRMAKQEGEKAAIQQKAQYDKNR
ncbi:MAG: transposase family protein, partial [Gammaproteobacteria bacterium]|nr:transposase family protein [Gammaproteobacteria bacterium]